MKKIAALAALLLCSLAFSAPTATAAPETQAQPQTQTQAQRVVYVNIGNPEVKPRRIFTAYSSSPFINVKKWKGWGTKRAVGSGVYVSTCASCAPPARRTAKVVMTMPRLCKGRGYVAYRKAIVKVSAPDEGSTRTTYRLTAPCR